MVVYLKETKDCNYLTIMKDLPTYSRIFEVLHSQAEDLIRRNFFVISKQP
ncbi:hypothetical protein T11_30 [Trichinella zimbabwensis]|uniref:Uncharacterized protein n=1 Tax=Trichinella zimbabwensis TaxID=268475 RepID=A0A0V1GLD0_9BILA|nr:hypothetical protein T11_30 [Trichinella zimbabwensis]